MIKKHKNRIFEILNNSNLGIDNFELIQENDDITKIQLKNAPLNFTFRNDPESFNDYDCYFTQFGPKYPQTTPLPEYGFTSFDEIIIRFNWWLIHHVASYFEEINGIDLFENYQNGQKLLNIEKVDFDDKSMFSLDERKQIGLAISDLKLLIEAKFNLNEKQNLVVAARLDYLQEAAERMNKFDWKSILISTIIGIATSLSLDTTKGHELYMLFKQVFNVIPQLLITSTP